MRFRPLRKNIETSLSSLKLAGLWSDDDKSFLETKFYWKYSLFLHVVIGSSFILGMAVYLLINLNNLELLAGSGYITINFIMPLVKSGFYLKEWSLIKELVKQLDQEAFQPRSTDEEDIVFSNFKAHRAIKLMYSVSICFLAPIWMLSPLLINSAEPKLPFFSWYPFDFRDPKYYMAAYIHQVLGFTYSVVVNWNLDLMTLGLMACLAAECDILSHRLRKIGLAKKGIELELVGHMIHHKKVLKFAEDANSFLGTLNFVLFSSTCLTICMTMFELSVLPPQSAAFVGMFIYQFGVSFELMIYCHFGDNVSSKSTEISDAIYDMPWIGGSKGFKKNTLFFLMRTQRPIKMQALNFFPLSLPTFTSIMRSSWSFFAMLHQSQLKRIA